MWDFVDVIADNQLSTMRLDLSEAISTEVHRIRQEACRALVESASSQAFLNYIRKLLVDHFGFERTAPNANEDSSVNPPRDETTRRALAYRAKQEATAYKRANNVSLSVSTTPAPRQARIEEVRRVYNRHGAGLPTQDARLSLEEACESSESRREGDEPVPAVSPLKVLLRGLLAQAREALEARKLHRLLCEADPSCEYSRQDAERALDDEKVFDCWHIAGLDSKYGIKGVTPAPDNRNPLLHDQLAAQVHQEANVGVFSLAHLPLRPPPVSEARRAEIVRCFGIEPSPSPAPRRFAADREMIISG
jgi:hypothetical protein